MGRNKKNIIFTIVSVIVVLVFIVLFLFYKNNANVLNDFFDKFAKEEVETVQNLETEVETLEKIDDETRYIRYLKASDDFVKIGTRDKKDVFCFAGDIFFSNRVQSAYDEQGIDGVLDVSYRNVLKNADLSVGNLECCITDNVETPEDKTWTFALPTRYIDGIKDADIDLLTLANNHILDYGMTALADTIEALDLHGVAHIGAADNIYDAKKVYIKEIEGKRYAILAASAVLPNDFWKATDEHGGVYNGYNASGIAAEIDLLKTYVDKVIVYMHWGVELDEVSNDYQKTAARRMIDAGADLIIGTHPHVVQEVEYYKGAPIVYSLGNFIYGGQVRDIIMVEATFDYSENENGNLTIKLMPGVSNYQKTKRYWNDDLVFRLEGINAKSRNCKIESDGTVVEEINME